MLFPHSHAWTPRQRYLIVAGLVIGGLLALSALVYSYQRYNRANLMSGVEHVEDLGFGFRRITIAKINKFGKLDHYPFLYYRNRLLSQIVAPPSISPSGNFAIYQDGRSGKLILFRRHDEKITELTKTSIGLAYPFVWHEDENAVEVELAKEDMSMVFPLQ
jgi:hypothetical protein